MLVGQEPTSIERVIGYAGVLFNTAQKRYSATDRNWRQFDSQLTISEYIYMDAVTRYEPNGQRKT